MHVILILKDLNKPVKEINISFLPSGALPRQDEKLTADSMEYYVANVEWDFDTRCIFVTAKTEGLIQHEMREMG